jgi:hypothetical protein
MPAFPELTEARLVFRSLFSKRVWQSVQILIKGAILAVGPRTVAAVLRVMGLSEDQQFQRFHRVLSEAKKVTRPPGRNPGLSPRQCNRIASPGKARAALSPLKLSSINAKASPVAPPLPKHPEWPKARQPYR